MNTAFRGHASGGGSSASTSSSSDVEEEMVDVKRPPTILKRLSIFSIQPETPREPLTLSQGYSILPYKGEDAMGTGDNFHVVCDGVGGSQVCSAPLSEALVVSMLASLTEASRSKSAASSKRSLSCKQIKRLALSCTEATRQALSTMGPMGSTLAVAYIDRYDRELRTFNVGDCKTIVVRNGSVVFETSDTVFGFNFPVQITTTNKENYASYGLTEKFPVCPGDVVVTFSDGVTDNLFEDEIVELIVENLSYGSTAIAQRIAEAAKKKASGDDPRTSPFAVRALEACEMYASEAPYIREQLSPSSDQNLSEMFELLDTASVLGRQEIVYDDLNSETYSFRSLYKFASSEGGKKDDITICVAMVM